MKIKKISTQQLANLIIGLYTDVPGLPLSGKITFSVKSRPKKKRSLIGGKMSAGRFEPTNPAKVYGLLGIEQAIISAEWAKYCFENEFIVEYF